MRFVHLVVAATVSAVAIACTSSSPWSAERSPPMASSSGAPDEPPISPAPESHGPPCEATAEGEGVRITIRSASCDYDRGSRATFEYEITTTDALKPMVIAAGTGCGSCRTFSDQIAPWTSWRIGGTSNAGTELVYCACDTGCCAPDEAGTFVVAPATFKDAIEWSGRTWSGPSDTGEKEGAYFTAGRYDAEVSFAGLATAKLSFVIRE